MGILASKSFFDHWSWGTLRSLKGSYLTVSLDVRLHEAFWYKNTPEILSHLKVWSLSSALQVFVRTQAPSLQSLQFPLCTPERR